MKSSLSLFAAGALVLGTAAMSASAAIFSEDAGFAFGAPPAGSQEAYVSGFGTIYDTYGRTIATAEPITDSTVWQIRPSLWLGTDADMWQINVTDAANFKATVLGPQTLALFDASGNALAAVVGGTIDASWLSGNGTYYLGLGIGTDNPRNAAGVDLFALSGTASGPVAGDIVLATDPFVAWEKNNSPDLIGTSNFSAGSASYINLAIPEPASLSLLALGGLAMLRRRA